MKFPHCAFLVKIQFMKTLTKYTMYDNFKKDSLDLGPCSTRGNGLSARKIQQLRSLHKNRG